MIPVGHGPHHQHDRQALVRVFDAPADGGAEEPGDDPCPVAPVQEEQCGGGPEMEEREHRDERRAGLIEIEPYQPWNDHCMPQRGHRKEFGDSLERGEKEDKSGAQHWPEPTSPSRVV